MTPRRPVLRQISPEVGALAYNRPGVDGIPPDYGHRHHESRREIRAGSVYHNGGQHGLRVRNPRQTRELPA